MQELNVNTGFGRFSVKDPIVPTEKSEVEEELKKFPMPFGRLTVGFIIGAMLALVFAQYWQNKHYGEIIQLSESIKSDIITMERNTDQIKGLVTRNEELANTVDSNITKLGNKITELRVKRSKIVNQ